MLSVRPYTDADYAVVAAWWHGHGWPPVDAQLLPKLGMVVQEHDEPVAAGWAYMDNSVGVAFMEWLVTRPGMRPALSMRALTHVVGSLYHALAALGYTAIHSSCRQPSLARLLERCGFTVTHRDVIHLALTN